LVDEAFNKEGWVEDLFISLYEKLALRSGKE
jgi:hypothetical protein